MAPLSIAEERTKAWVLVRVGKIAYLLGFGLVYFFFFWKLGLNCDGRLQEVLLCWDFFNEFFLHEGRGMMPFLIIILNIFFCLSCPVSRLIVFIVLADS